MHLKTKSVGASRNVGARLKDAADTVLGTGTESSKSAYDLRSGVLLTFILLFVAGWIPMFGQMIAGYVGGRKAGSPYRGFAAAAIATFSMLFLLVIISASLESINAALLANPDAEIAALKESSPFIGQMAEISIGYLREIFGGANMTIDFGMYMLTIVFGVIGGVLADQTRKEMRLIVSETNKVNGRRHRSIEMYRKGRSIEFESYEDYRNIAVNTMASQTHRRPVKTSDAKPQVVTGTVDNSSAVMSTPTSTSSTETPVVEPNPFSEIIHMQEKKAVPQDDKAPADAEDISDCI